MPIPDRPLGIFVALLALSSIAGCEGGGGGGSSGAGGAAAPGATGTPILAGAARVDCTTQIGAPLGGYGGGGRRVLDAITIPLNIAAAFGFVVKTNPAAYNTLFEPSTGIHDPLGAKALVIERGGRRFALLSLDMIGVSRKARDSIAARVAACGITSDHIMISATHTHSGPGAVADKVFWQIAAMDLFDQRVYDLLIDRAAQAVIDAAGRLGPARIGYETEAENTVQHNRRGLGIVDPDLTTIAVERPDGTPIALVVNLAVHGICFDENSMVYSADLMGYCEREVEAQLGNGAVCLYLNGAEGDVSPNHYGESGAESVGKTIARHALQVGQRASAAAKADLEIAVAWDEFRFPQPPAIHFDKARSALPSQAQINLGIFQTMFNATVVDLPEDWFNRDIPLQAMRLGDLCLMAVPGEPLTNVSFKLKAAARGFGFVHPVVVGLANDHLGYVADDVEYDRGGYEAFMTFFGRDEARLLGDALLIQVDRIKP